MEKKVKKEKKSLKPPEDTQSGSRRSTRYNTRATQLQSESENAEKLFQGSVEMPELIRRNSSPMTSDTDLRSKRMNRPLEENLLAFLDTSGNGDLDEILEDRMMFIEATHSICVVPSWAHVPSSNMYQAILRNIQECKSVGLSVSSFDLLMDLEKRHPRVAIKELANPTPTQKVLELVVDENIWSPVEQSIEDLAVSDRPPITGSTSSEVSFNLFLLLEAIANRQRALGCWAFPKKRNRDSVVKEGNYVEILSQYMMLQYLITLIQADFSCRLRVFEVSTNYTDFSVMREAFMYRLVCCVSQVEKKSFLTTLVSIMDPTVLDMDIDSGVHVHGHIDATAQSMSMDMETAPTSPKYHLRNRMSGLQATSRDFGDLASTLMVLVMKIDHMNQEFGTATALSRRNTRILFDNLLIFCTKSSTLDAYLKAVDDPRSKLRFVMDYFLNFAPKPVVERLMDYHVRDFMEKLLDCLTDQKTLKAVTKVFKEETTLPLLLSHGFQAFLVLHNLEKDSSNEQNIKHDQDRRTRVCKSMVTALSNLQTVERQEEMLPISAHTLFIASRMCC